MTLKEYQVYQQLCLVTIYLNMKMCISCTIHDPKIYLFKMYIILIFLENKRFIAYVNLLMFLHIILLNCTYYSFSPK